MTNKILTQDEFEAQMAAHVLHYKVFHDAKSARKIADLILMSVDNKILPTKAKVFKDE